MKEEIVKIAQEMQDGSLEGSELEEKEFCLIEELCGTNEKEDLAVIFKALGVSGTILAIPALCAHLKIEDSETKVMAASTIGMIKARAKARKSLLPDHFFTTAQWRPEWRGSKNAFLSYVQLIADTYIKMGHSESELNRIGGILAEEMHIDIAPYRTIADFMLCQTTWDFKADYQRLMNWIEQEKAIADLEEAGIMESDISFIQGSLMELQYDYIVARLKLKGNLEYFRFILKMAECLNKPEI
jgi:hypothetical protein